MTHGQALLAHGYALDLCDFLYRASLQPDDSAAHETNVTKAKVAAARIAELLNDPETADKIRRAA